MFCVGFHELTIDDKNRLSIPASIRSSMDVEKDGAFFYLAPGERENTLDLFPEKYFPEYVERLHQSLKRNKDAADFETFFLSMSAPLEMDKQGRVLLPQQHLQYAGMGRQIMLTGNRDRLVMWNREEGQRFIQRTWGKYIELMRLAQRGDEPSCPPSASS